MGRALFGFLLATASSLARAVAPNPGPPPPSAPDVDTLEPIEVTAQKFPAARSIDRRVYDVTKDLQHTTGTAADLLNDIPSVEVDADGVVSLRGDSNVLLLIDGKPSAQLTGAAAADGLFQLSASEIERIEVLPNPPVEFKADGAAGVINIVTKKARRAGTSGTLQASVGNDSRYVLGASGGYGTGPAAFSGSLGLRQDERERVLTDHRAAIDPATQALTLSRETVDEHVRRLTPSLKGGFDYRLDEDRSLALTLSRRERFGDRNFGQYDESSTSGGVPESLSDRASAGHEWRLDDAAGLQFEQHLSRPDEVLKLALQHSLVSEREHYDYANTYTLPGAVPSYDDLNLNLDLRTTELSADYVLPLANGRIYKGGADVEQDIDDFGNSGDTVDPMTGERILNPAITNYFRFRETIGSLYGSLEVTGHGWTVQSGLRVEDTAFAFPAEPGFAAGSQDYLRAYPSIQAERRLSKESTLTVSLGRRVTRPDPEALNPYIDRQDTQNLRAGNPNLRPEDTWSGEIGYNVDAKDLSYALTGYRRRNRNSVTDVTQVESATVVLVTKENLPTDTAEGIEMVANGRVARNLSFALSANLFHDQIDATALAAGGLRSTTGVNLKASLDYHPSALDTAQITFSRSDKRLTPQGFVSAIDLVNVGFRHHLRANLSCVATVSDLFNGQILRRFVGTPTVTDQYERTQLGRIAYVGVIYAFGAPKKNKSSGFDYEQ